MYVTPRSSIAMVVGARGERRSQEGVDPSRCGDSGSATTTWKQVQALASVAR
ncbi:hypothetical protein [Rhodococcus jostii]|jgi:hypothetical protein|uniref:Uncharacterized protein n=1 Tax=Rhodococcus jostii TaxID=132919 RepID=A0ABU4CDY2_RHOJO|nr:hypothetical protein [Rhodococcus jostii]MDV6281771.1 hypothetical protein [Rhodococcus jostii]